MAEILINFLVLIPILFGILNCGHGDVRIVQTRMALDTCDNSSHSPFECRNKGCHFDCFERQCSNLELDCSNSGCGKHCNQPCECRKAGCNYDIDEDQCRVGHRRCPPAFFVGSACYSQGIYYSRAGVVCLNVESGLEDESCQKDSSNSFFAVNFAGPETKVDNVIFQKDSDLTVQDPQNIIQTGEFKGTLGEGTLGGPQVLSLYNNYIEGNPRKRKNHRCVTYTVNKKLVEGVYSGCLYAVDPKYTEEGKRSFNVMFNNVEILHEVDIAELAVFPHKGIQLCFGFNVTATENKELTINFHGLSEPAPIQSEMVPLSFCYSRCKNTLDGSFVASAFELTIKTT